MRRIFLVLVLCCASATAIAAPAFKGMSYTSFNNPADLLTTASDQSIANMKTLGVDTVALNVWWFQSDVHQNTMAPSIASATYFADVQHAIDTIHNQGMKVFLKPMLDVNDGTWRAYINPTQPDTWFGYNATTNPFNGAATAPSAGSYGAFIDAFADLAEANKSTVTMLSVGCELNNMEAPANDQHWRDLIDNVRTHYSGPLTYSANWSTAGASPKDPISVGGGYNNIGWWDKFDASRGDEVGIDAYFPVGTNTSTESQLQSGWTTVANNIDSWRTMAGVADKRLLFTETGYASYDGAAASPYASPSAGAAVDEQEQSDAYQAQLAVMSQKSWWDGAMWWNWETTPNSDAANGYSPQNKLVQDVLASNYGGTVPALSVSNWTTASSSASFTTGSSWTGGTPNQNFVAQFNRGSAASYIVTLPQNTQTNNVTTVDQVRVGSNTVTFESNSATSSRTLSVDDWHTDTSRRGVIIGVANGDAAIVNLAKNGASGAMTLTARAATIGDMAGAAGTLNVNNATVNIIGSNVADTEFIVGRGGNGALMVQGGGKVNVNGAGADATIGDLAGGVGSATVTGTGSSWTMAATLRVGRLGQGGLTVASGGTVTSPTVTVGANGTVQGDGTIVGALQNSGIVAPGVPFGALHITGTYTQTSTGHLQIEVAGASPGQYDQLLVSGVAVFDGALDVALGNYSPTVHDAFNVLDFGFLPLTTFASVNLPTLGSFLAWDQSQLYTAGVLSVISVLPGDYNGDGVADAADYTVWRSTFGQNVPAGTGADSDGNGVIDQADYDFWSLHFGQTVGSLPGAGAAAAVPEPTTAMLALFATLLVAGRARRASTRIH